MIFISAPYSHPDTEIVQFRFKVVCEYAAKLFNEGNVPFSPVIIGHTIAQMVGNISVSSADWEAYSKETLILCDEIHILTLPGWEDSSGVTKEFALAKEYDKLILMVEYNS